MKDVTSVVRCEDQKGLHEEGGDGQLHHRQEDGPVAADHLQPCPESDAPRGLGRACRRLLRLRRCPQARGSGVGQAAYDKEDGGEHVERVLAHRLQEGGRDDHHACHLGEEGGQNKIGVRRAQAASTHQAGEPGALGRGLELAHGGEEEHQQVDVAEAVTVLEQGQADAGPHQTHYQQRRPLRQPVDDEAGRQPQYHRG